MADVEIRRRQHLELHKITIGALAPLDRLMGEADFLSVVERMRLASGAVFPLPVVLDVDEATAESVIPGQNLQLFRDGQVVGEVAVEDVYTCDKRAVAVDVFGTDDPAHPGVASFYHGGSHFIGGPVSLTRRPMHEVPDYELTPVETRGIFAERGWKTIAGFQTRNVPHRAHEYLQRIALELTDGLFIQPLVGWKKRGDYLPSVILAGYEALIRTCYPAERVLLGVLSMSMRYAGPREAVLHALVRRNYGCTHFIVGRDHAGVGGYYGTYDAHALTRRFEGELGIEILRLHGPFYCRRCGTIATERTCRHVHQEPGEVHEISGTDLRRQLSGEARPAPEIMRPEVAASLAGCPLFIEEDEA